MSEINKTNPHSMRQSNVAIIALILLVIAAIGAAVFFSGRIGGNGEAGKSGQTASVEQKTPEKMETAAGDAQSSDESADRAGKEDSGKAKGEKAQSATIEPGNPIVAKIDGKDITRLDVFNFIQTLSPQTRQMPIEQLFPLALEQVVNAEIIGEKVKGVNLDDDPAVQEQLKAARQQIVRSVFVQKEAEKAVTEDMIKAAYEDYRKSFPKIDEVKARHILVKDETLAKDLIKKIEGGADFAELAKQNSIDATKENGGELSFFSKQDVVPQFGEAAFAMNVNEISKAPVKSDFGYHIIQVLEKRQRPPAEYDEAKPYLAAQLRGKVLGNVVQKWRDEAKIEIFDINGNPLEPTAGSDKPARDDAAPKAE